VQWGTFQLTAEPIDDPPIKLEQALVLRNVAFEEFELLNIGEIRVIP
jgi:N-acyl-phosphatidylethanolamine-hydrolysing phospholipase D